ncbi:MAG: hypothetical protein ABI305_11100 [Tepidiformaceae bacterium]
MDAVLSAPTVAAPLSFSHIPTPYDWTLRSESIHALEHASVVGTAMQF